jgi:hypothetical protein
MNTCKDEVCYKETPRGRERSRSNAGNQEALTGNRSNPALQADTEQSRGGRSCAGTQTKDEVQECGRCQLTDQRQFLHNALTLKKLERDLWGTTGAFTGYLGGPRENRMGTKVTLGEREFVPENDKGTSW